MPLLLVFSPLFLIALFSLQERVKSQHELIRLKEIDLRLGNFAEKQATKLNQIRETNFQIEKLHHACPLAIKNPTALAALQKSGRILLIRQKLLRGKIEVSFLHQEFAFPFFSSRKPSFFRAEAMPPCFLPSTLEIRSSPFSDPKKIPQKTKHFFLRSRDFGIAIGQRNSGEFFWHFQKKEEL